MIRRRNRVNGDHVQVHDGFEMGFPPSKPRNALYEAAGEGVERVSGPRRQSCLDIERQDAVGLLARSGVGDGHGKLMVSGNGHP